MKPFKKLVYCDFEFLKKLRSSNSHLSPFSDAYLFWFNTLQFILKSSIQLNIDTQTFLKNARKKRGDTFFELWKRVANGECEVHFLEDHNIKFIENKICTEDAIHYAYLIKEGRAIAQHYAKSLGVIAISSDSWSSNDNAKSLNHLYRDSGREISKSEKITWAEILRSKEYHLSECNSMIITDNYLLKDLLTREKNLYPILEELLPITLGKGREFHLTLVASGQNFNDSIYEEVKVHIKKQRPYLPVRLEIYIEGNSIGSLHDRAIVTNNVKIEIPGGFDLIKGSNVATKETKASILYPGVQSCSDPCDGTYTRILACCSKIIRNIRKGNGGKHYSDYEKGEINRLLSYRDNEHI